METLNEFPEIMGHAREDLGGNVGGKFSPENWDRILNEARERFLRHRALVNNDLAAWTEVVREFHRERYWGYSPNWRPPPKDKKKKQTNMGVSFIWMTFTAFIVTKISVVWLGQIYTRSDDPVDKWLFFGAIALTIANFAYFLWRSRHHKD